MSSMTTSDSALARTGLELTGTLGATVRPDPHRFDGVTTLHLPGAEKSEDLPAEGHAATSGTGVLDLARAIRAGWPDRGPGELAHHVLDVMLAIEESIGGRRTVTVDSTAVAPVVLPPAWDPYARTLR